MRCVVGNMLVPSPWLETSPSARNRRSASIAAVVSGNTVPTCGVTLSVTVCLKMDFFLFQKWMNNVSFCYFCVELNIAPKIMKLFVRPLWDVNYLGKILNVNFQYILNVKKLLYLINKWVSMFFLGLNNYSKIMKIVLPLSYHVMSLHKNFEPIWRKLIYFIIIN